jgi:hypothetical protein
LAKSRSSHFLKSEDAASGASNNASEDDNLSSWARYLKNKYGGRKRTNESETQANENNLNNNNANNNNRGNSRCRFYESPFPPKSLFRSQSYDRELRTPRGLKK